MTLIVTTNCHKCGGGGFSGYGTGYGDVCDNCAGGQDLVKMLHDVTVADWVILLGDMYEDTLYVKIEDSQS